ncbi:MAG: nucleotidyl transferase AbiEii/AbiGii toxin family protein [Bacteroidales bacterium]|nr:nucleotidyl transferase AbiEii/AbiGii toxin family protein [Bacteroidales bacterium]
MIPKHEIVEQATQANLQTHVIEKDYVLGWLLAGISQHAALRDSWVFKGGTCLKKCYFETYRFSEDLDFTLRDASHIDEAFLLQAFTEIAEWAYEQSGVEMPADRLKFEIYTNPRGINSAQGRVYYKGPATYSGKHSMPRIKLDLSVDEVLVDEPVVMPVRHDFSDCPEGGISVQSYSYAEVFAEKIRALKERTRPRDLYDVINFYRRPESREVARDVKSVLAKKCEFKAISLPSLGDLDQHKDVCSAGWKEQLSHQLQALPPFDSYWNELPAFFSWLDKPESAPVSELPEIPAKSQGETRTITLVAGSPQFSTLERVRFAAVNRLCVELDYRKENGQRQKYVIEPYSLRATSDGHLLLYGVKLPSAEVRCFRTDRIIGATVIEQPFTPRYSIDFIPEGPVRLSARQVSSNSLTQPQRRSSAPKARTGQTRKRPAGGGPKYVFKCSVCGKQFTRSTHDASLKPHKNRQGHACYGSVGIYVKTRY